MPQTEVMMADELAGALGYMSKASLNYLVVVGELAPPTRVFCADRRWRSAWPRDYVDRLMSAPPPRLARQIARLAR